MSEDRANRLFTISSYPIRYLVIPKCACTFTKNLLWFLENRMMHDNPRRVHDDDAQFIRASDLNLSREQLLREEYAFSVLRNPVDRFFSLYTDKVVGNGYRRYVPLRTTLASKYGLKTESLSAADHTRNCEILIDWLEENLRSEVDLPKEAHWTPQSYREGIIREFDLKILLVGQLNQQLSTLLHPLIPEIDEVLSSLEQNRSTKPFPKGEILKPSLRKKINAVYSRDRELFELTKEAWSSSSQFKGNSTAPRYSQLPSK